jgi:hypothetical protein
MKTWPQWILFLILAGTARHFFGPWWADLLATLAIGLVLVAIVHRETPPADPAEPEPLREVAG